MKTFSKIFLNKFNNSSIINTNKYCLFYLNNYKNFATKMRGTTTKNSKDSAGKRLGLKVNSNQEVHANQILIRQRGLKYKPGENIHVGKDQTLHSSKEGFIKFTTDPWENKKKSRIHIVEKETRNKFVKPPMPFNYHPELYPDLAKKNVNIKYDIDSKLYTIPYFYDDKYNNNENSSTKSIKISINHKNNKHNKKSVSYKYKNIKNISNSEIINYKSSKSKLIIINNLNKKKDHTLNNQYTFKSNDNNLIQTIKDNYLIDYKLIGDRKLNNINTSNNQYYNIEEDEQIEECTIDNEINYYLTKKNIYYNLLTNINLFVNNFREKYFDKLYDNNGDKITNNNSNIISIIKEYNTYIKYLKILVSESFEDFEHIDIISNYTNFNNIFKSSVIVYSDYLKYSEYINNKDNIELYDNILINIINNLDSILSSDTELENFSSKILKYNASDEHNYLSKLILYKYGGLDQLNQEENKIILSNELEIAKKYKNLIDSYKNKKYIFNNHYRKIFKKKTKKYLMIINNINNGKKKFRRAEIDKISMI